MDFIVALVREYGVGIVFLNVLIEQLGAPIPAYPVLMVTGAIQGDSLSQQLLLIAVAVLAALIADGVWYAMGRRYGRRVLARVCKISLSPDSCVQNTESLYSRWGAKSLLIAKFVPGFASIASALAGAVGTSPTRFVLFDGLGALL
jgi:membrane protein DedA with SNARE-associated domain